MKHICNTTGKNNFSQKLAELKEFLGPNNVMSMQIFVHFILSKRIVTASTSTLNAIYIDIIRQLGIKGTVEFTIMQIVDIFKKCLCIDEESYFKVAHRAN